MSVFEDEARKFWNASTMLRRSAAGGIIRRAALGRLVADRETICIPRVANRFTALIAENYGELVECRSVSS